MPRTPESLTFDSLRAAYAAQSLSPHDVVDAVLQRIADDAERLKHVWLHIETPEALHVAVDRAMTASKRGVVSPLLGIPFAVKDNIDVAGMPTTAACPAFAYTPTVSATVVRRLVEAGAIVIGKVNLDQFATGLVGTRSPYGTPTNPFDARMIPGGSSSGSGVAVAAGHVSFSLGTDTAGSGRVPAAFGNIVGLKPSRGALSTRGVVPACRSLDCVSVFALTVADACSVANVAKQWDPLDPFSRIDAQSTAFAPARGSTSWRVGIPPEHQIPFFGDTLARAMFVDAIARLRAMRCEIVEVDFRPFREAGSLLYGSAFVAERLVASRALVESNPELLVPVVRDILVDALRYTALDAFEAQARLAGIRQAIEPTWRQVDALVLPTAPTIYTVDEVLANPRELNANVGVFATFVNLLDLAAVAVPSGFRADGLPFGITWIGPRGSEPTLIAGSSAYHASVGGTLGATGERVPVAAPRGPEPFGDHRHLVVVGAHLAGQPLNHQLTGLGATLVESTKTAPVYRLYALRGTVPPKPGLARVAEGGAAIDVEVWSLDTRGFGAFVAGVPSPMCIGTVELENGRCVQGFLCEQLARMDAEDISHYGGWRAYLLGKASA